MSVPKQVLEQDKANEKALDQAMEQAMKRENAMNVQPPSDVAPVTSSPETAEVQAERVETNRIAPAAPADDRVESLQEQLDREHQLRRTLEGRLKSQLKPANDEIRRLRQELDATNKKIQTIEQHSKKPGAERLLSDEEREELGDVLDVNSRMVKGILEEELEAGGIQALVQRLIQESLEAQQKDRQASSGPSDDFWPIVESYSTGSREINRSKDPRWMEFLSLYDSATGRPNREIAEEAMANDDPISLAEMFDHFKRQYNVVSAQEVPYVQTVSTRSPKPETAGGIVRAPETRKGQPEPWTQAEMRAFFTDVSKGKFRGREQEAARIEAEIMAAVSAGRVI